MHKAVAALDDAFLSATPDHEVLFALTINKTWLRQLIVGLTLICHSSYRGVCGARLARWAEGRLGRHAVPRRCVSHAAPVRRSRQHSVAPRQGAPRHDARPLQAKIGRAGLRGPDDELATQLALAGPALATRQMLFDFIVEELARREPEDARRIRPVRVALQNQRDTLLAFAGVLDEKLADIAQAHATAEPLVREACVLHRLPSTSPAYWQGWNQLRATMGCKFHVLFDAVSRATAHTARSSSLVENLNSRLRTYSTLRRYLGSSYLDLLRFFLNHRRSMRSRRTERQGKSPRELMTGSGHPHWLTLLGLGPLQPQRA